ncbi:MAG: hypothetical protein AAFZ99_04475 [Pseudomonadota bacterium]
MTEMQIGAEQGGKMKEYFFLEEKLDTDLSGDVLVEAKIFADEENSEIIVEYRIVDRIKHGRVLEQSISFKCADDIYITKFDPTWALGAYGVCVANKLAHATYDQIKDCYDAAKASHPSKGKTWDRIKDTAECLSKKTGMSVAQVKKALKECLTFGLILGGGSGP